MTVRVRGIYATALTRLLREAGHEVVQASGPIQDRFNGEFADERAAVTVATTDDQQGVGVVGDHDVAEPISDHLAAVGRDTLRWDDPTPEGAVYAGKVTETLGSGAVVDLGDGEGFLPYSSSDERVETGDAFRVQVIEASAPWTNGRPVLDTTVAVRGSLLTLVRGRSASTPETGGPAMLDLIASDPRDGWGVSWEPASEDASFDALADALDAANDRAAAIDDALAGADAPEDCAPTRYDEGLSTAWLWFGRESRFALDDFRREVTATMPGHHRVKTGDRAASAAVDYVEALCDNIAADGETDFPFAVTARQFGPQVGGSLSLGHGKPDGRLITLGSGEVQSVDDDGTVTIEREMSAGGSYDALGVPKEGGDIAETKVKEGRWWYPTVYRDSDGEKKGTYVNVCTPVEIFPDTARYVDLHVDVVKHADGTVERVDDDELDPAVERGHVPEPLAERARSVAAAVKSALE
jgi:Ribonuclease G/E